jgi:hypothetical protein
VGTSYVYPLESPAAGVAQLNATQKSRFSPASASGTTATPPPVIDVALSGDTITFETYELTDGTWWLLPVYHYQGAFTGTTGAPSTGTWEQLAIDPAYVRVNNSVASAITP